MRDTDADFYHDALTFSIDKKVRSKKICSKIIHIYVQLYMKKKSKMQKYKQYIGIKL